MYSFSEEAVVTGAHQDGMAGRHRHRRVAVLGSDAADGRVKRLLLTSEGRELGRRGIRIAVDLDEEMFSPGGDLLRQTSSTSRPEPGPLPDPQGGGPVRADPSPCRAGPQRDSNPCRRLERAVS